MGSLGTRIRLRLEEGCVKGKKDWAIQTAVFINNDFMEEGRK